MSLRFNLYTNKTIHFQVKPQQNHIFSEPLARRIDIASGKINAVSESMTAIMTTQSQALFVVPENVEVLKIVKMLDTLVLGKILLQDAAGEYVSTTEIELLFRKINILCFAQFHCLHRQSCILMETLKNSKHRDTLGKKKSLQVGVLGLFF